MSAFSAAIGALFRDPNLSVPAVYTAPGATPLQVRVLRTGSSTAIAGSISTFKVQAEADTAELRAADVPNRPPVGSTLEYDGSVRVVATAGASTRHGLTWIVALRAT